MIKLFNNSLITSITLTACCLIPAFAQDTRWWNSQDDRFLVSLLDNAIRSNHSLESYREQVTRGNAQKGMARSKLFPSISANSSVTHQSMPSQFQMMLGSDDPLTSSTVSLNGSYQLDAWGKDLKNFQATSALSKATLHEYKQIELSFSIQLATVYVSAIHAKKNTELIRTQIENARTLLELSKARYNSGQTTSLVVLQQEQQLAATEAGLAPAIFQERIALERLSSYGNLSIEELKQELPNLIPNFESIKPNSFEVEARQDVKALKQRLKAAKHNETGAKLSMLPSIGINGNIGYEWMDPGANEWGQTWSIGANISLPLFRGGYTASSIQDSKAAKRSAESNLKQAITDANTQINSATEEMITYEQQANVLENQMNVSAALYDEILKRYQNGLIEYSEVLLALNTKQQIEIALLQISVVFMEDAYQELMLSILLSVK